MTNIKKYAYSEILSFYSPCDPPQDFQSDCPVFTSESQSPVVISNFKPNPNFGAKPFNFVPKKTRSSDSSNDNMQKPAQVSKVIDFRPQNIKDEKNGAPSENKNNDTGNISLNPNYANPPSKYRFRPESITKPISSSAPPTSINESKPNSSQIQNDINRFEFKPQREEPKKQAVQKSANDNTEEIQKFEPKKDVNQQDKEQTEQKKIDTQNEKVNKDNNRFFFRPQKEGKENETPKSTTTEDSLAEEKKSDDQKELLSNENKKGTPWASISIKPQKKSNGPEKINNAQLQLQKEIDNSLISSKNNSSDEPQKSRINSGFAPKKLDQAYEAPEPPTENQSKPKSKHKTTTNFDDIEKEEKNQKNQPQPQQQPKKSLFETLIEQEKQNKSKTIQKEVEKLEDEPPKKRLQVASFKPKQTNEYFDGQSIDELNKASNTNRQEVKSGFSALMEQEKITSEREKKEKEIAKQKNDTVKKPSIVDILIAETIQEKSKEKPKTNEEEIPVEKEKKPLNQGFKPLKATSSYEAPSIEEIENFSKQQQKKTTFSEALANQKQDQTKSQNTKAKPSFDELQKREAAKQPPTKKQGSFSNAPSFFDILMKEEKKEKEIAQSSKTNDISQETETTQKISAGFNPKRNKPETGSFSEMLDKEKKLQKEKQSKSNVNAQVNVKVNTNTGSKRTGNYPSFAQLINDEARIEEQRSTPLPQFGGGITSGKNSSFQQKIADEELKADASTIGDIVNVQGELPKKWINKKSNRGKKRGGKSGKTDENSEFFWGTADLNDDSDDDQNGQDWPSVQGKKEEDTESSSFGFASNSRPTTKDSRVSWLSKVLEDELGEENPWEFAESLVHKSKPEMIRFLSTITFDQQEASNIANRFFQMFPAK